VTAAEVNRPPILDDGRGQRLHRLHKFAQRGGAARETRRHKQDPHSQKGP
jgi:hypothetical protein